MCFEASIGSPPNTLQPDDGCLNPDSATVTLSKLLHKLEYQNEETKVAPTLFARCHNDLSRNHPILISSGVIIKHKRQCWTLEERFLLLGHFIPRLLEHEHMP